MTTVRSKHSPGGGPAHRPRAAPSLRQLPAATWRELFTLWDCYVELPGEPERQRWLAELQRRRPGRWRQLRRLLALERLARQRPFLRERLPGAALGAWLDAGYQMPSPR